MQKGIFYNAKDALWKTNKEYFLQKEGYLCIKKGQGLRKQKGGEEQMVWGWYACHRDSIELFFMIEKMDKGV